ncbi:hypothetical protein [Lusitaniella coriacea]|uniref:hypothetical protein n=1 Tax=Lusitaniella coriacea TaxID=1983105 RepID=UPI003CF26AC4
MSFPSESKVDRLKDDPEESPLKPDSDSCRDRAALQEKNSKLENRQALRYDLND